MQNINTNNILKYWENNLADTDRRRVDISTNPIKGSIQGLKGVVPKRHCDFLWSISKAKKTDELIEVAVSPCKKGTEYEHEKAISTEESIHPFWIPALMNKEGLLIPKEEDKPYFVRD